jgi:hypothetical protein
MLSTGLLSSRERAYDLGSERSRAALVRIGKSVSNIGSAGIGRRVFGFAISRTVGMVH